MSKKKERTYNSYRIEQLGPRDDGCDCLRLIFLSVALRTLTNPPISNHSTLHISHYTPASALGGVAPPRGGETRKRLDEPTPDQVRGDERRAAPAPALRQAQGPGRGTPKVG